MRKLIYKAFLTANILFAAALIFSYLSVHINPVRFALPALFGLAYPYLLLINIIFAVIWAIGLKYEALISVAVIAAGITHFSNYLKIRDDSNDKTGTFKVLSYNVRLFNYFEGRKTPNSERKILEFLKNQQPDIICLQEIYILGNPDQKIKAIKSFLGESYHSHIKIIGTGRNRYYGIVTFSKYPIIRKGDIVHPGSSSLSIFTDLLAGKDTIRIYNNHLQSFRLQRMERSFLSEITESSDDKETLGEIKNISSSLRKGFARRATQAHKLKEHINKSPLPVIVAGDFNDTPVSYSYRKIRKGLSDSFVTAGNGAGFTYKGNYPPNRIDYILYNAPLVCRQFDIIKIRYSDHYPVAAYLRKAN